MFYVTQNLSDIIEVMRKDWAFIEVDVTTLEESSWEILNVNNEHEGIKQHWFKQNNRDHIGQEGMHH